MERHGILYLRDPVVALDLAEIASSHLAPIKLHFPTTALEAAELLGTSLCIFTDRQGARELESLGGDTSIPYVFVGTADMVAHVSSYQNLKEPFTTRSVLEALGALGLNPVEI